MDISELNAIIERGETQNVDFKGPCAFDGDMRPHLAAAIGSMANTRDGGTLVIGVENTSRQVLGLSNEQIATFDPTRMSAYLKERLAPLPRVEVSQINHPLGTVLLVRIQEFEDVPVLVVRDIASSKKTHASAGNILIRSQSCECRVVGSADEMRDLLSRALTRRSEALLTQIRAIMSGAPPTQPSELPEDIFARELPDWDSTVEAWQKQRPECAWWEVKILPIPLLVKGIEPKGIVDCISKSSVRWRGWYFPTFGVRGQEFSYLQNYVRFAYDAHRYSERWQASYVGAFASSHIVWGDLVDPDPDSRTPQPPERLIDFQGVIWSVTEFFRFATSMAEALNCESLWLYVALHNVAGRPLSAFDPRYSLLQADRASMSHVVQRHVFSRTDLASAWREHAIEWTQRILTVFQWPDAMPETLAAFQTRLIERRY